MKMNKLVMALATGALVSCAAFAQSFTFQNTVASDIIRTDGANGKAYAASWYIRPVAEYKSKKVDFKVDYTIGFLNLDYMMRDNIEGAAALTGTTAKDLKLGWAVANAHTSPNMSEMLDYYVEFRPIDMLTICYHDNVMTDGAVMPLADRAFRGGNMTSNGLAVCVRPISGLRIGAGIDQGSLFGRNKSDSVVVQGTTDSFYTGFGVKNVAPAINFGADYTYAKYGSIGFGVENVLGGDDLGFGIYATCTALKGTKIKAGYSYNDSIKFKDQMFFKSPKWEGNFVNLAADWKNDKGMAVKAEAITTFGIGTKNTDAVTAYDLYASVDPSMFVAKGIQIDCRYSILADFAKKDTANGIETLGITHQIRPQVGIYLKNFTNVIMVGGKIEIDPAGKVSIGIPVSYTVRM